MPPFALPLAVSVIQLTRITIRIAMMMEDKEPVKLTARQAAFVREYAKDRQATAACIRAGYSPKGAAQQAHLLLRNPKIAQLVQSNLTQRGEAVDITAERVLRKWGEIGFGGGPDEEPNPVRLRALELIAKHLGMLDTRLNVSVQHTQLGAVPPEELGRMLEALRARAREVLAGTEPLALPPVDVTPVDVTGKGEGEG